MIERVAFGQGGNHHCQESETEEPANALQTDLVGSSPDDRGEPLEEFRDGELCDP